MATKSFAVLLPDTDETGAFEVAERIRQAVSELSIQGGKLRTTISAGTAAIMQHEYEARDTASLVESADRALYQAKDAGRNIVMRASGGFSSRKNSSVA